MGYLQALRMMVKAYKAARGVMPKGLDLLKLKMKARQKVIDSNKVVEFPKDKITPFFKPRPRSESEAQMLARMKRQNKESVARLKEKKDLGDKLKDLPDDIPDMRAGGVASAIKKIKKRFGKKSITTGDKIKRPGNRQLFDDFKKRNKFNVGGMANLSQTYDNNPTLQAQFPNKQDYLDLFGGIASTTVAQTTTPTMAQQATQSTAINPIKPIIPIPESGDSDDITTVGRGRTASNQPNYMGGKEPGIVAALQRTYSALKDPLITYNPMNPAFLFNVAKAGKEALQERNRIAAEKRLQQIIEEEQKRLSTRIISGGGTIDSGNTGGYGGTGGEGPSAVGSSGMLGGGV